MKPSDLPVKVVSPFDQPGIAIAIAVWEAQQRGDLTEETMNAIAARVDEVLALLVAGMTLAPKDGRYELLIEDGMPVIFDDGIVEIGDKK